ncbi:MAG: flavin reductase family protein [Spartobacteria bacterium]|nr:flavin reductase family protein [Spartobacteria bacterium]
MSKISIGNNVFVYPMPVVLIGTMVAAHPNFMTVAWVARVNSRPPMIAVALGKTHYTNAGIKDSHAFTINVPSVDLLERVDYAGMVSGRDVDKSTLFTVVAGRDTGAPMIEECSLCMECRLTKVVDLPADELFIGDVVGVYADETCCVDGKPDIEKIRPFTLSMPDSHYCEVGSVVGKAWHAGGAVRA